MLSLNGSLSSTQVEPDKSPTFLEKLASAVRAFGRLLKRNLGKLSVIAAFATSTGLYFFAPEMLLTVLSAAVPFMPVILATTLIASVLFVISKALVALVFGEEKKEETYSKNEVDEKLNAVNEALHLQLCDKADTVAASPNPESPNTGGNRSHIYVLPSASPVISKKQREKTPSSGASPEAANPPPPHAPN